MSFLAVATSIATGVIITSVFAQSPPGTCYPPEYTASGELILPKNFHEWIYVGSPLTPNALNGGHAGFPEFHNVYIEPCSYAKYDMSPSVGPGWPVTSVVSNPIGSRPAVVSTV